MSSNYVQMEDNTRHMTETTRDYEQEVEGICKDIATLEARRDTALAASVQAQLAMIETERRSLLAEALGLRGKEKAIYITTGVLPQSKLPKSQDEPTVQYPPEFFDPT